MAVQTVVASYPAPVMPLMARNCISNPNIALGLAATNVSASDKDMCILQQSQSSSIAVKPVASPHNELVPGKLIFFPFVSFNYGFQVSHFSFDFDF